MTFPDLLALASGLITLVPDLIALAALAVILVRVICVLDGLHWRDRTIPAWQFIGFGLSYILLAGAAAIVCIGIHERQADPSDWMFLAASAGLILFDRRRRT